MTEKYQPIPHRLKNMAVGGHVAGAEDIDAGNGKTQQDINADTYRKDETYSKEQVNHLVTTPNVKYVTVLATDQTTAADIPLLIDATGKGEQDDTIYRIGNWNGEEYDTTVYSEYSWDGTEYVHLDVKEYGIATAEDFVDPDSEKRGKIVDVGAAVDVYGKYINNDEYRVVVVDKNKKIVEAVDKQGIKHLFGGVSVSECVTMTSDNINNSEYLELKLDGKGKIIEALKQNGTKVFSGDVDLSAATFTVYNTKEWLACWVDGNNKIVLGIKPNGKIFADGLDTAKIDEIEQKLKVLEEEIIGMEGNSKLMKVVKNGTDIYIRTALSDTTDIIIQLYKNTTSKAMTFNAFYVGDNSLDDTELIGNGLIRKIVDMVGAIGIRSFWFLYGQHGWTIPKMKVTTQTLTNDDIGSIWTDGTHQFTIGNISGTNIYLLPIITKDNSTNLYYASWDGSKAYPTTLTHVSGAVHTDTINGTSSRYDLVIQDVTKRVFMINNTEITEDGTYYCDEFTIKENILGYNVGTVEVWFPISEYNGSLIDWDRTFIFKGSMCTCNTVLNCQYPFEISDYRGCIPQMPLQTGNYHSYSFIPKIKKLVNEHRVDVPFDSDDGAIGDNYVTVVRNSTDLYDVDDQPERCISYLKDNSGNYLVGMAGGCSLVRGISKPEVRNAYVPIGKNSCTYGGPSTPNKFYPKVLQNEGFENGIVGADFINELSCYFCWFNPNENDGQVYWYKDGSEYIVYIHNQNQHDKLGITLPDYMEGLTVKNVIEKTVGASLLTTQVVSGKLYVSFDTTVNISNYIVLSIRI